MNDELETFPKMSITHRIDPFLRKIESVYGQEDKNQEKTGAAEEVLKTLLGTVGERKLRKYIEETTTYVLDYFDRKSTPESIETLAYRLYKETGRSQKIERKLFPCGKKEALECGWAVHTQSGKQYVLIKTIGGDKVCITRHD